MTARELVRLRLRNQLLARAGWRRAEDVVTWMGAVQAQEYEVATWGIGLRMRDGTTAADVKRALDDGRILRTHVLRPTWHFVTAADIGWLQKLTGPKVQRLSLPYNRRLGLDAARLARGITVLERALRDGQYLTRAELGGRLRAARLPSDGPRLAQIVMHAEAEGVICSGPTRGRQFTYALIAERAPNASTLSRDQALGTLARRYLQSHGPATVRDFVWWSGLATADARRGLEIVRARPHQCEGLEYWTIGPERRGTATDRRVHLLPVYDEYTVAYRDRAVIPQGPSVVTSPAGKSISFRHALVVDGRIAGTWRTIATSNQISVEVVPLGPLAAAARREQERAADRYRRFVAS